MPKSTPEYNFFRRLSRRFDWAGYVAVKCAPATTFDMIVMKDGYVAAVELKSLDRDVDPEQREKQRRLAERAGIDLILLRQLPRGMVLAVTLFDGHLSRAERVMQMLQEALGKYLVVE